MTAAGGPFILSGAWPAWLLALGAAAAAAGWLTLYKLAGPVAPEAPPPGWRLYILARARRPALIATRFALAFAGVWLGIQLLAKVFLLTTTWSIWPMALGAAALGEALIWLYALERRIVPGRKGVALTALRLALLGLLLGLLLQPVWASTSTDWRKRALAVLIDDSASMRISDPQLRSHEKLRLAEMFSLPAAQRPYRLEEAAENLQSLRRELAAELGWLDRLAQGKQEAARAQLARRRKELHKKLNAWTEAVAGQVEALETVLREVAALDDRLRASLLDAKATLNRQVRPRLLEAASWTHQEQALALGGRLDPLRGALRRAAGELTKAAPVLAGVGDRLDSALYGMLPATDRSAVDAIAALTRRELAVATLLHPARPPGEDGKTGRALLAHLAEEYDLSVFTFSGALAEEDPRAWKDPVGAVLGRGAKPGPASSLPAGDAPEATPDTGGEQTDLAGAMREVMSRLGGKDLAGMMVFSDGQHNGPVKPEPLAGQLGGQGAAFCAAVMGAATPPPDAAIVSIEAPETVFLADRMLINAELKLDGLAGKQVKVTLFDAQRPVDSQTVSVGGDVLRTRVQLADEPKKVGMHAYRIEVRPADEKVREVFADNNSYSLSLSVVDDKTNVLLIDCRPRWEFRYLKNLFSGRDKTVRLQYVLTDPDRFLGQAARAKVPASAGRGDGIQEATLLPKDEGEWMKFDVVIVGDVAAKYFTEESMRILRRFVNDRGGTLILIAGSRAMPGEYAATPLAELIPLQLGGKGAAPQVPPPGPREGFQVALTPAGMQHVIMRQDVQPDKCLEVWRSMPKIYWRSRFAQASPASEVLAYALEPKAPKWLTGDQPAATTTPADDLAKRRREYRRSRALVAVGPRGLGKVMMLTFDRTWRLRYRAGDTRHHKFWGQVLRWATAGELPAGTHLVKLGADRRRYPPRTRPKVRAKIVREDFSPVVTEQVAVKVFSSDKLIARTPMKYLKDSPGIYSATLDELPAGTYRLELDAPPAAELLAKDGLKTVSTEISIDPAAPTEQIELAANADLLGRLANLSHNGAAAPPYQAHRLLSALPAGTVPRQRRLELSLKERWPPWVLLGLFCAAAAAEWILRKRFGLA